MNSSAPPPNVSQRREDYFAVNPQTIQTGSVGKFDLYLKRGDWFVLYAKKGETFSVEHKLKDLHYSRYIEKPLRSGELVEAIRHARKRA